MSLIGDIRRLLGVAPPKRTGHVPSSLAAKPSFNSASYWEHRYRKGRTSGSGSYGRLAEYKAAVVNDLVARHHINSIVEFGCGDGNQCRMFEVSRYVGVDVSPSAVEKARSTNQERTGWQFMTTADYDAAPEKADMALSLDVIYHLVEDRVFDTYMARLVASGTRLVVAYASDHDADGGSPHVRHRRYSDWIRRHAPHLRRVEEIANRYPAGPGSDPNETSFAFFQVFARKDIRP